MFRNWQPTLSCASCQSPPPSPAPQVSDAARAVACVHRCYYRGTRHRGCLQSNTRQILLLLQLFSHSVHLFSCWCFHILPVNRSTREKLVRSLISSLSLFAFHHGSILTCVFLLSSPEEFSQLNGEADWGFPHSWGVGKRDVEFCLYLSLFSFLIAFW